MNDRLHRDVLNRDGWCVAICPGCGTQIAEWLDEDGGPGHVEEELCPMCSEADREEFYLDRQLAQAREEFDRVVPPHAGLGRQSDGGQKP